MKNTVIISRATLKDDGQYNIEGNDIALDQAYVNDAVAQVNIVFKQENIRRRIRTNGRIRTRAAARNQQHATRRASTRFFTKWLKRQDRDVHDVLKRADPYIRKKHMENLKEIYINEGRNKKVVYDGRLKWSVGGTLAGGYKKAKRSRKRRKKRKNKTRRRREKRRKTKKKGKEKGVQKEDNTKLKFEL